MYLIGRIKNILHTQKFKNNFKKKSIIIITDEQYPQNIIIDFVQDKIDLLNFIKINDKVKIFINIKGREWINKDGINKYFNSIQAWKIEKIKNENLFEINSDYINNKNENDENIDEDDEEEKKNKKIKDNFNDDDLPF
ncbi:MAG: DUF3127 domain-containing protein [Candidatus Shikimatogenerans bostrichidophilus]|nr:MAG: DUF3127 domain-containing protein [Candidatus Shikimatogenerans bostrichidophilus]